MDWDMYTGSWPEGPQEIEIKFIDPSKPYAVNWTSLHLTNEENWREFLEALKYHGKLLGWEEKKVCRWTQEPVDDYWASACGYAFTLTDEGMPGENDFLYCPKCGGKIEVVV